MTERRKRETDSGAEALAQATERFVRLQARGGDPEELASLMCWLEEDPGHRRAYEKVSATWSAVGRFASAPEIMKERRDALEDARAARLRRNATGPQWLRPAVAAACAVATVALSLAWWSQARAGVYSTGVGERRSLTLADGSVVTLDARSRIRVTYRGAERRVLLEQGQARFDVAKDPSRPFRVKVGSETIVALGTQFDVELVARSVRVTMIEGHVQVLADRPLPNMSPRIDLVTGEALHIHKDGRAVRLSRVDVQRVTAWQYGKLFFDNEPLGSAAERINRYAARQIQVDPSVADIGISGVFNVGGTQAFVEAVTEYFPVRADEEPGKAIRLTARN